MLTASPGTVHAGCSLWAPPRWTQVAAVACPSCAVTWTSLWVWPTGGLHVYGCVHVPCKDMLSRPSWRAAAIALGKGLATSLARMYSAWWILLTSARRSCSWTRSLPPTDGKPASLAHPSQPLATAAFVSLPHYCAAHKVLCRVSFATAPPSSTGCDQSAGASKPCSLEHSP